jgi:hypothetical protein
MAQPPKLTLVPYLQQWNATQHKLHVNLLVMPVGSPLDPLGNGLTVTDPGPSFAQSNLVFKAFLSKDWQQMPGFSNTDFDQVIAPSMSSNRSAIFQELARQFNITKPEILAERNKEMMVRKHLMKSYRESFAFVEPKTPLASIDDTYSCLLNCPPKKPLAPPPVDNSVSWAEAMSFALRQPLLAREMGLVYELEVDVNPHDLLISGGWIFFTLDGTSDYHQLISTPGFLKVFGSRIPALKTSSGRRLFTPVLFPVVDDPTVTPLPGNFDEAFLEFSRFNDGFAKIVHASQPRFRNLLQEEGKGAAPVRDEGVQLAWDDEDILIAHNRQVGVEPDTLATPAEAPTGVVGYRIDVRKKGDSDWHSLSKVTAGQFVFGGINYGQQSWESKTEVFPSTVQDQFWLPSYFTRWKGGSLVVTDPDDMLLLMGRERTTPLYYHSQSADEVVLKYGEQYEFRVRMVDITNGGPALQDDVLLPGETPVCQVHFKRFVPPGLVTWPEQDPNPSAATLTRYTIKRPVIDLPQALYTNYPNARATLLAIQQSNRGKSAADVTDPSVPDIDASTLSIRVMIKVPDFDPVEGKDKEGYVAWYQTYRSFPANLNDPYQLNIDFVDCNLLSDIDISAQTSSSASGSIVVPSARDVKIELRAIGSEDYDYFGNERARLGAISRIYLHRQSANENNFFLPSSPQTEIRSVYLQPTDLEKDLQSTDIVLQNHALPVLTKRLSGAIGLASDQTTIMMPPGTRGIFGCSKGLKHYMPANNSSVVFMAASELTQQWINVCRWDINRDWTWKGFDAPTFIIERSISLVGNGYTEPRKVIGEVKMMHAVSPLVATEGVPNRDQFSFLFFDAFQPPLGSDNLPYEVTVTYYLTVQCENGSVLERSVANHLPVTTPPKQIPKVVSAGIALSPYVVGEGYASTNDRRKMLWLEFDQPPLDHRDGYFVRVLAHTADPMLLQHYQPLPEPAGYTQWGIDPETVRVITPGQSDDYAGLTTMQRLIPASDSDRHYLVPLPPGTYPDSPELFGFYTYEIRVGHDKGSPASPFWSTAQGRFGPPVMLDGVQHPCSPLHCNVSRVKPGILVSGVYAKAFQEGLNVQALPPNTELWFVLYAQVKQADGSTMRNIELNKKAGRIMKGRELKMLQGTTGIVLESNTMTAAKGRQVTQNLHAPLQGYALWQQTEVEQLLDQMGLSEDTPLSVLGVELLPEPNGRFEDPLGGNLGQVRILRTSALYKIESLCC